MAAEVFSLISTFVLTNTIAGLIGNRSDAGLVQVWRIVTERVHRGDPAINHDIQRAVRRSQVQATRLATEACMRELGAAPNFLREIWWKLISPSTEVEWLAKARQYLFAQLKELENPASSLPHAGQVDAEDLLSLLRPGADEASVGVRKLREALADTMLFELGLVGLRTGRIEKVVREGWEEVNSEGETAHWDWFEALCAFFALELKHKQALANIIQTQLLVGLTIDGVALTPDVLRGQLRDFSQPMLESFRRVEELLGRVCAEQSEDLSDIKTKLDNLFPALLLLHSIEARLTLLFESFNKVAGEGASGREGLEERPYESLGDVCLFTDEGARIQQARVSVKLKLPVVREEKGMRFVLIPPGRLPRHKGGYANDNYFYMAETPVTEYDWARITGADSSAPRHVAKVDVTQNDLEAFLEKINRGTRARGQFALPTSRQWRFVASAGGASSPKVRQGLQLRLGRASAFGVYDLTGVVWQFCRRDSSVGLEVQGGSYRTPMFTSGNIPPSMPVDTTSISSDEWGVRLVMLP